MWLIRKPHCVKIKGNVLLEDNNELHVFSAWLFLCACVYHL